MRRVSMAALCFWAWSAPSWAAIGYSVFRHPLGDYSIEYPADWKRLPGLQLVDLKPPGRAGQGIRISLERHPVGSGSPTTAEVYVRTLLSGAGSLKKLDSRRTVTVSGIKATRVEITETATLKGEFGQALPGPLREVHIVIPTGKTYYVLQLQGVGESFRKALPEFERIAARLRLGPPDSKP